MYPYFPKSGPEYCMRSFSYDRLVFIWSARPHGLEHGLAWEQESALALVLDGCRGPWLPESASYCQSGGFHTLVCAGEKYLASFMIGGNIKVCGKNRSKSGGFDEENSGNTQHMGFCSARRPPIQPCPACYEHRARWRLLIDRFRARTPRPEFVKSYFSIHFFMLWILP